MSSLPPLPEIEAEASKKDSITEALDYLRTRLREDHRTGAKKLILKFEKKAGRESKETQRLEALWKYEKEASAKGYRAIAGVDEAGRGPLAGPVVAAAVILPFDARLKGVDDSKKLSAEKRDQLFDRIHQTALAVGVGQASVVEIDDLNIYRAAQLAMERAIGALDPKPDFLLTDAMPLPKLSIPQRPLVHGDALSATIAAASIIAKVTRDRLMEDLHQRFPMYGFENHKGYGTVEHLQGLESHGPCLEHRLTFAPVMETLARKSPDGPFGYWKDKLMGSKDPAELQQVGLQIKRAALEHLDQAQAEALRNLFRDKRKEWERPPR